MAKKKVEKEIINELENKLNETPDVVTITNEVKSEDENKPIEPDTQVETIIEKMKDLKENTMDKIVEKTNLENLNEESINDIAKEVDNAIKEVSKLKDEVEKIVKPEIKIRREFTNYWNGTSFGM